MGLVRATRALRAAALSALALSLLAARPVPAAAAAFVPIQLTRNAVVDAVVSTGPRQSSQAGQEVSFELGRFDVTTSARAAIEEVEVETSARYLSEVGPDRVTADLLLEATRTESPASVFADTDGIVELRFVFEVTETIPFALSGRARAVDVPAEALVLLRDEEGGVLFELRTSIDIGDPLAGFDEPFAAAGTFAQGTGYELIVLGVTEAFVPTEGALDIDVELLLIPQPASGLLLASGLALLASRRRR